MDTAITRIPPQQRRVAESAETDCATLYGANNGSKGAKNLRQAEWPRLVILREGHGRIIGPMATVFGVPA